MAEQNEQQKQWAKIVAKAWIDKDYKLRLLSAPASIMKEEGVEVPEGLELKCVEASDSQAWLVLPPKPDDMSNIVETDEERIAAFTIVGCFGSPG